MMGWTPCILLIAISLEDVLSTDLTGKFGGKRDTRFTTRHVVVIYNACYVYLDISHSVVVVYSVVSVVSCRR